MTLLEIFLIGIGLSMDAFAVAICKGLAMPDKVHKRSAFLIALYFGVFQAVMPALGRNRAPMVSKIPSGRSRGLDGLDAVRNWRTVHSFLRQAGRDRGSEGRVRARHKR